MNLLRLWSWENLFHFYNPWHNGTSDPLPARFWNSAVFLIFNLANSLLWNNCSFLSYYTFSLLSFLHHCRFNFTWWRRPSGPSCCDVTGPVTLDQRWGLGQRSGVTNSPNNVIPYLLPKYLFKILINKSAGMLCRCVDSLRKISLVLLWSRRIKNFNLYLFSSFSFDWFLKSEYHSVYWARYLVFLSLQHVIDTSDACSVNWHSYK